MFAPVQPLEIYKTQAPCERGINEGIYAQKISKSVIMFVVYYDSRLRTIIMFDVLKTE